LLDEPSKGAAAVEVEPRPPNLDEPEELEAAPEKPFVLEAEADL
jgi:hypothetical protein